MPSFFAQSPLFSPLIALKKLLIKKCPVQKKRNTKFVCHINYYLVFISNYNNNKPIQYLVGRPREAITASQRLGMDSMRVQIKPGSILPHSSYKWAFNSSWLEWICRPTAFPSSFQRCSMGLRSGDCAGHGRTTTFCSPRKSFTT